MLLGACGENPLNERTGSGDAIEEVADPTGDPLWIGVIVPQTGTLSSAAPSVLQGVTLAVEQINAAGGVQGQAVEVRVRDSRSTPEGGLEAAIVLSQNPLIKGFVGPLGSSVSASVLSVATDAKLATISPASTSPQLTVDDEQNVFFRTVPSDRLQAIALAEHAFSQGFERAGIMYVRNIYGCWLQALFDRAFTDIGGQVVERVGHDELDALPDYARDLEKIAEATPDVVLLITFQEQGAQIMLDQKLVGIDAEWLFADGLRFEALATNAGADTVAGIQGAGPASPSGPQWDVFRAQYIDRWGLPPNGFDAAAYDAVHLLALSAERAEVIDRPNVLAGLNGLTGPPGEPISPGSFGTTDSDVDFDGDPTFAEYELYEFQPDGTIETVATIEPVERTLEDPLPLIDACLKEEP